MEGVGDKGYIYPRRLLTDLTKAFQKKLNSGADQKYLSNVLAFLKLQNVIKSRLHFNTATLESG